MTDPVSAAAIAAAFQPVNALEACLVAAAGGDRTQQLAFERRLPDETLYVATPDAMPEGQRVLDVATPVRLMSIALNDGRRATAVFTAPERILTAFGEGTGCLGLPGRTLFEMIRADPAVLNPGQPYGVVWEPDVLSGLAGLPVSRVLEEEARVLLGAPKEAPTALMAALEKAFRPLPQVRAAWLALAYWPGAEGTVWHLDVRADGDPEPVRRALGAVMSDPAVTDRKLDMIINPPGGEDGVGLKVKGPGAGPGVNGRKTGMLGRLFGR